MRKCCFGMIWGTNVYHCTGVIIQLYWAFRCLTKIITRRYKTLVNTWTRTSTNSLTAQLTFPDPTMLPVARVGGHPVNLEQEDRREWPVRAVAASY